MTRKPPVLPVTIAAGALALAACQAATTPWVSQSQPRAVVRAGAVSVLVTLNPVRSTLARVTDIDHLEFDLSEPGLPSEETQIVPKAQVFNTALGPPGVTFGSLPAGLATLTLVADDVNSFKLGSASQSVPIVVGQTTTLHMALMLDPTFVYATPAPTPAPTPSPTPVAASLAISASIWDGPIIVVTPTPVPATP